MTDITNLFKAIVKTMKLTDKSISFDKTLLRKSKLKSEFSCSAKEVVSLITKLRDFLYENKKEYEDASGLFGIRQSRMTDLDRDRIDKESEIFMKSCRNAINTLSLLARKQQCSPQTNESKENILFLLEHYLIDVCKIYSDQKSLRVNRLIKKKRISRLEPDQKLLKKYPDLLRVNVEFMNNNDMAEGPIMKSSINYEEDLINELPVEIVKRKSIILDENQSTSKDDSINLSSEEKLMLQLENERLYNEMSGMVDELKQIEGKIVEISRLQDIFTENVLQQEKDIYRLADNIVGTTENVKGANEEIREAMKNKAGLLVWILFFLIVNTLSLLFLDWYND